MINGFIPIEYSYYLDLFLEHFVQICFTVFFWKNLRNLTN